MSQDSEDSVQTTGFWIAGWLSVVLAVLKLSVGPLLVVVAGDAAIAYISGPQRAVYPDWLDILPLAQG